MKFSHQLRRAEEAARMLSMFFDNFLGRFPEVVGVLSDDIKQIEAVSLRAVEKMADPERTLPEAKDRMVKMMTGGWLSILAMGIVEGIEIKEAQEQEDVIEKIAIATVLAKNAAH